ncbi:MAG: hypothetical protein ACYC3I_11340, partial [Gemmataceae bacterium]
RNGAMAQWRNGAMAQWRNGAMAQWRNGAMAQWRNGAMAQWRNGAMAQECLKLISGAAMNMGTILAIIAWAQPSPCSLLRIRTIVPTDGSGVNGHPGIFSSISSFPLFQAPPGNESRVESSSRYFFRGHGFA